ncbi:MAG: hypothetical protein QGH60_08715 [Phycisphaerae bacterium]|jgi:hypothetical protein|nr:hypothetical protein [Phycisphaerae bacterium]
MAEMTEADQQPEYQPGQGTGDVLVILKVIKEEGRHFPSKAHDGELERIASIAGNDLSFAFERAHPTYAQLLHSVLSITLAEQQRRLNAESLKQSEALARSSQEMAEHSKDMAVEAAKSAKIATWLVIVGIIASLVIGTLALTSSNNWEHRQLRILERIEQRMPATQPAKETLIR